MGFIPHNPHRPFPSDERRGSLRVLHVINTAEVGGGAEHLLQLTRGLAAHGITGTVWVGRDGPASGCLRQAGVAVEVLGRLGLRSPWRIAARLRKEPPDLCHLHGSRAGLAGALATRLVRAGGGPGLPFVYTAHAFSFRRRWPAALRWAAARAEALTCSHAERVICLTRGDFEAAAANRIEVTRFVVVPNGIELARFPARSDRRAELGIEESVPIVGMIARLVTQKDPIAFVRMARVVASEVPEARFVLVGDGPLRPQVEQEARDLLEGGRLFLTGLRSDVPELLATLDVVAFVSLWEGLPLALLEAMAASRAVVATEIPGHREVIDPGENGVLVPVGDPGSAARAVIELLRDPMRRCALGRRARARVEERHTMARMVEQTLDVYRSALAGQR